MKKTYIFLFLVLWAPGVWAGTEVKAKLQSFSYPQAWVDLDISIDQDKIRVDFNGPWTIGSLIYDRETSLLVLLDHFRKTMIPISSSRQELLKLMGSAASGRLKGIVEGSSESGKKTYKMIQENTAAFFNGTPNLVKKGVAFGNFVCDDYVTDLRGEKAREVWVSSPEKTGMGEEDYETFRSLAHLVLGLCESELAQMGADSDSFQKIFLVPELPIVSTLFVGGKSSCRFKVLSIHSQSMDQSRFATPTDYRELSLLDMVRQ